MTDKLEGLNINDRVKMTVVAHFGGHAVTGETKWMIDGAMELLRLTDLGTGHPDFQIERIEPPLKVGDRVRYLGDLQAEILALADDRAWVRYEDGTYGSPVLKALERIT